MDSHHTEATEAQLHQDLEKDLMQGLPADHDSPGSWTEQELLVGCQANQRAAWEEFISRFTNLIYYVIKVRCGFRDEDAQEIYQGVFVKLLRNIGQLREETKLRSWLLAVTWNECIDYSRKRKTQTRFFVPEEACTTEPSFEQEHYVSLRELLGLFKRAFKNLSPAHQDLLAQKYRGATVEEIARSMNIPKGSIYYNHKKACKEFQRVLVSMNYRYEELQEAFPQVLLPLESA